MDDDHRRLRRSPAPPAVSARGCPALFGYSADDALRRVEIGYADRRCCLATGRLHGELQEPGRRLPPADDRERSLGDTPVLSAREQSYRLLTFAAKRRA